MDRIEVKSGEYHIVNIRDDLTLYSLDLGAEVAVALFSIELKKACLGRNLKINTLSRLLEEMNPYNMHYEGLISVSIIGGNDSEQTDKYIVELLQELQWIDNESNVIDIISFDAGARIHPDSFEFDCYNGGLRRVS